MSLPRLLALVSARRLLLGAITLAAALLALGASLLQDARYEATADLVFGRTQLAEQVLQSGSAADSVVPERAAATNLALASLDTVAVRVRRRLHSPKSVDELKDAVRIQAEGESDLVSITAEEGSPAGAARLANAFADEIVSLRRETAQTEIERAIATVSATITAREASIAGKDPAASAPVAAQIQALRDRVAQLEVLKALETGGVRIAERATAPESSSAPRPLRNTVIAGFVGLVLGLFLIVLLARFDERVRDEDELAELIDAPVLARIPEAAKPRHDGGAASMEDDLAYAEAFRFLRSNLQLIGPQAGSLVVAVTSPGEGDGKTTVVSGLATSLALTEAEVVAVDCDLRRPTLHARLGVADPPEAGVLDALLDARSADELARPTPVPHLRVLPAGGHGASSAGLIAWTRLQQMFEQLVDRADYVLADSSPVSMIADASTVAAAADGVILVVDLERVRRKDLQVAKEQLGNARAKVLGIVLNRVRTTTAPAYAWRPPASAGGEQPGDPIAAKQRNVS